MPDTYSVGCIALTAESFAPFGQLLSAEPDEGAIALRDDEQWILNVLSYDHRPLVCDHLNAHRRATQMLVPLSARPALLIVAPPGPTFTGREDLAHVRAFVLDGTAAVNLGHGTWHWGPYPIGSHVDLLNLQGRGFATDNEVVHLERDLDVVVIAQLSELG
ncbi:MAG: ureidoglycolate lyase [Actinomycetota bacterium]|nr:ureidoglycolate lyase [Actinomycetota bacterium]